MQIADILGDEGLRQREFPVAGHGVFLGHAGVCPLPRRVAEAMSQCVTEATTGDQESKFFPGAIRRSRQLASQLLDCDESEIALVGPTSMGLSFVAGGLEFKPGENVIIYRDDYPSNVYPWMALADRGVEIRFVNAPELGVIRPEDVLTLVDARTRLVSLASCHFIAGLRIDIDSIGKALRERGVLFCVDGIQTVGAFPTPVRYVDFLAADAHKWMLGPCAAGILYVSRGAQDLLRPISWGWHNVSCPDFVAQESMVLKTGAQRYEAGTHNLVGLVGMNAALEILLAAGTESIAAELLRKRTKLVAALADKGWRVLHAGAGPSVSSGIVSFWREDVDMTELHARLLKKRFTTSLRSDRQGCHYLRLSPHFYNTDEELNRLLQEL